MCLLQFIKYENATNSKYDLIWPSIMSSIFFKYRNNNVGVGRADSRQEDRDENELNQYQVYKEIFWSLDQVHVAQPLYCVELGSPRQQEGIHLHGVDGHREGLLHLHAVVHQGERHLLDISAEQLGEHLVQADLPTVGGAAHPERSVGRCESLSVKDQGGLV